jgi:hypothetical protein
MTEVIASSRASPVLRLQSVMMTSVHDLQPLSVPGRGIPSARSRAQPVTGDAREVLALWQLQIGVQNDILST